MSTLHTKAFSADEGSGLCMHINVTMATDLYEQNKLLRADVALEGQLPL